MNSEPQPIILPEVGYFPINWTLYRFPEAINKANLLRLKPGYEIVIAFVHEKVQFGILLDESSTKTVVLSRDMYCLEAEDISGFYTPASSHYSDVSIEEQTSSTAVTQLIVSRHFKPSFKLANFERGISVTLSLTILGQERTSSVDIPWDSLSEFLED